MDDPRYDDKAVELFRDGKAMLERIIADESQCPVPCF